MERVSHKVRSVGMIRIGIGLVSLLGVAVSQAQTTSITSSGLNTHVSHRAGSHTYDITGGTRPGNGTNLFHSFGDLSVGAQDVARFLNDTHRPTTNILSRVTGGHVSNIFGEINTTNFPGANLYLINPAGVLFGPTATLNVSGSVHVSTADYLRLADGSRFNAVPGPRDALLSHAPVVAFGFLTGHPRPITVQGSQLSVPEGKGISLVGGDIQMTNGPRTGALNAPSGKVFLVSLAGRGEASLNPAAVQPGLTVTPYAAMGSITLKSNGLNPPPLIDTTGGPGGTVVIRGGHLVMNSATIEAETVGEARAGANQHGGGISIVATNSVTMNSSLLSTHNSGVPGSGAGSISIAAPSVILRSSAINAATSSDGPAGDIVINSRSVQLSSSRLSVDGPSFPGEGAAGHIAIQSGASFVSRDSTLSATNEVISGGRIEVGAERVTLERSHIVASAGNGGGGPIHLTAKHLTLGGSQIRSTSEIGDGGPIHLAAEHVTLKDSQLSSDGYNGGIITVAAKDVMLKHSQISSNGGNSKGGAIDVGAEHVALQNSQVSSKGLLEGGTIVIDAKDVTLRGSQLTTSVSNVPYSVGGRIVVDAKNLTLRNSKILSTAMDGRGGLINIRSHVLSRDTGSVIDASSRFGQDGTVTIQTRP